LSLLGFLYCHAFSDDAVGLFVAGHLLTPGARAVFFDAVGTLICPEPPAAQVYAAVGRSFGSALSVTEIGKRFRDAFARQEAEDRATGLRTSEDRERRRWHDIVGQVLDDVTDPVACFEALFEHFARPDAWRLDADAAPLMTELAQRGQVLGMASNYDRRLRRVVAGMPELMPLHHLVISSEAGWRKPAPEFYAAVCRTAGLSPDQIVHVGDDVDNDYEAARAAGLRAVLFDPQARLADGRTVIRRLTDLL
jgi:putative hydrolase of the HAD superfamily